MEDKFKFDQLKARIATMQHDLPIALANQAQNYFVSSFTKQAWDGTPWQEVKRRIPGTVEYKYPADKDLGRRTRPILIGKGSTKLRRAVASSIRTTAWPIIRLVVDLPYAKRHNDGLNGLPKRTYMGQTKELTSMQLQMINDYKKNL